MRRFSLVSFNVNRENDAVTRAATMLALLDADLVCLQENTAVWEAGLRHELAAQYPHAYFHNTGGPGGIGALSKFPITSQRLLSPEPLDGWFEALMLRLALGDGRSVSVLNLHLRPPYLSRGGVRSIPLALSYVWLIRWLEVRHFLRQCDGLPEIVCGDFNEGHWGLASRWLARHGFRSATTPLDPASWRWPLGRLTLAHTLDQVRFREPWRLLHSAIAPDCGSDHRPLQVVLGRP